MRADQYLKKATRDISHTQTRKEVMEELESCIEDLTEACLERGMKQEDAEEWALQQMGEPGEVNVEFHRIYRPGIDWKEVLWFAAWAAVIGAFHLAGFLASANTLIIRVIGILFIIVGLISSITEKCRDLPFFYAWAENWGATGMGGLANAALFCAIGTGLTAENPGELLILGALIIMLIQTQRLFISRQREKKEQKYLWEVCTAEKDFNYQSKVKLGEKRLKVRIKKGELAKKGDTLIITGIDGFMLLVEKC